MDKPRRRCVLPPSPCLSLDEMSFRDLQLLVEFFESVSDGALLFLNQPRATGPSSEFAENFLDEVLLGWKEIVLSEVEARKPNGAEDAKIRATVLVREMALDGRFAEIGELAGSVTAVGEGIAGKSQ